MVINGTFSDWAIVTSGVPQGTVLGLLLFLIYVNDSASVVKHSTVKMFADDVLLYAPANTLKECSSLQNNLTAISSWASCWQLKLNPTKCKALMITNKCKPIPFTYSINHQPISWSNPVKYLGVQVDSKLSWSKHCKFVVSKGTKSLNYLRRSMFGCNRAAKCAAYKAIIRPMLEYGAVVWNPHNLGDIQLLESLQKRAA